MLGSKDYEKPQVNTDNLYRTEQVADSSSLASMSWDKMFTDEKLQSYINEAIQNNLDMKIALQNMAAAEATMKQGNAGYFPTLNGNATWTHQEISQNSQFGRLFSSIDQYEMSAKIILAIPFSLPPKAIGSVSDEDHPFLLGVLDLFGPGGHLRTGAAIDDRDVVGPQSPCGPGGVHGHVPPPITHTLPASHDRRVVARKRVGLHQVARASGTRWPSRRRRGSRRERPSNVGRPLATPTNTAS